MELLFKREQSLGEIGPVAFQLWGKIELNDDEQALVKRYRFDETVLIYEETPNLLRNAALLGALAGVIVYLALDRVMPASAAGVLALTAALGTLYWHIHNKRETIFVRDLLHGRHFSCRSIIDLSKKEAHLAGIVSVLRQVMESAKHWDGTERHTIEALPKEEARALVASL
ncbi:MAG: hypothetical protein ACOZAA_03965 [Pseudomonadota bacterium]